MNKQNYSLNTQRMNNNGSKTEDNPVKGICSKIKGNLNKLDKSINEENLYLPEGWAYIIARNLGDIKTNQIRKIFEIIKDASSINEFLEAKKKLYTVVPIAAYAKGRNLIDNNLYELIESCVTKQKIQDKEDIKCFSKFFESIIAYYKKENKK